MDRTLEVNRQPWFRCVAVSVFVVAGMLVLGCGEPKVAQNTRQQQNALQRANRGEALIDAAANQLADLPSAVDTELRPPTVILDATKSRNGQDVYAIAAANPQMEGNPVNIIGVPGGNGRFKSLGVQSGDLLKFYIIEDETVDAERQAAGFSRQLAKQVTVAQVIDDNTLLIEGSLPEQVFVPAKLEVWRNVDDRLKEINEKLVVYTERRLPAIGWEPAPDGQVMTQIVAWLNQWLRQAEPKVDWQREPMLDSLDATLVGEGPLQAMLTAPALASQEFVLVQSDPQKQKPSDAQILQEAVWLRDIARWAQGTDFNDLARATALFDWTIRNIQLVPDEDAPPHQPWRTLADGRGTAEERAWVFALLCRQQGLDVVVLEIPSADKKQSPFWLPALVLDGQLYLFDTQLGLPVPGPGGKGVATLTQVQQDDSLLRALDLEGMAYPVDAESAKRAVANVVASPFELSKRARQLESKLTGDKHLVLSVSPSSLAEQLKAVPGITGVRLWEKPFRTLSDQLQLGRQARRLEALAFEPFAKRPLLWKARTRHFQGRHEAGRTEEASLDDHRVAAQLYTSKEVRPTDTKIAGVSSSEERRVNTLAKQDATYWVGLLSFDDGRYEVAADWLKRAGAEEGGSPWADGARYNLARTLEAMEKPEDAAALLEKDQSPQRHGNQLRAKKLREQAAKE